MEQALEYLGSRIEWAAVRRRKPEHGVSCCRGAAECLNEVAHDASNMVTVLSLFCDMLQEPGVLARKFAHYGRDLRQLTSASQRLVERLVNLPAQGVQELLAKPVGHSLERRSAPGAAHSGCVPQAAGEESPAWSVANAAEELLANRNLLAALAGPSIALTVEADGGTRAVWMMGHELTRVLVNLVKNAAEAMPAGGRIRVSVSDGKTRAGRIAQVVIAVEDSGPGIPEQMLERIFERGYTTRTAKTAPREGSPARPRGLGLAISRSIVEAAGGRLRAMNRPEGGARLEMELPVAAQSWPSAVCQPAEFVVS